jgi:MFS family permease
MLDGLVLLLSHIIGLAFWQLLMLVFVGGLLRSPAGTARESMVPELAKLAHMRLERANAFDDILAGLAVGPINSLISTVMQEHTPPAMRARVFGLLGAGVIAGIPLATLANGFVVTWIDLRATLAVMGAIYLLATLSILINPALKKMEKSTALAIGEVRAPVE